MQIVPISLRASARQRLVDLLDAETRWSFLRAPAGYDKVATVLAWLHAKPGRLKSALWIETISSDRVDAEAISAILDGNRKTKILVLDATHVEQPLDLATLKVMASHARHIVVLARSALTLPDHLPAMVDAKIIDPQALAYLPVEIAEATPEIDEHRALSIHEMTTGWPALVRLVSHRNPHTTLELGRMVISFAEEQLTQLSSLGSKVLHATCVVREPTVGLSMKLTDLSEEEVRQGWSDIVADGLAAEELANREILFRVVPLVQETYLGLYQEKHPDLMRELNKRAAEWFVEQSQPLEAAHHAIAAEDWDTAVDVIVDAAFLLFAEKPALARELVERIPLSVIEERPVARILQDLLVRAGGAEAQLSPAVTNHADRWDFITGANGAESPEQYSTNESNLGIGWREALRLRREGDFTGALEFGRELHSQLADTVRPLPSLTRTYLPIFYLQSGITSMLSGHFGEAENDLVNATRDGKAGFGVFAQRNAFADLALLAGIHGDIPRAQENLNRMAERPRIIGFFARVARFGELVAESLVATARLDFDDASSALAVAAESADRDELWAFYLLARARCALAEGSGAAALAELGSLGGARTHLAGPDSASAVLLPWAEAELLMATGHAARAGELLEAAPRHPLLSGVRVLQKLQVGDPSGAIELAGSELWTDEVGPASRALGFLARAAAELQLAQHDNATRSFRFAHTLITRFEQRHLLGRIPHDTLRELVALSGLSLDLVGVPEMLSAPLLHVSLTDREIVVLRQLATGVSLAGIARALFVSENTVRTQVRSVYRKLGVNNRDAAVAEAQRRGIAH